MKKILVSLAAGSALAAVPAMAQDAGPAQAFDGFHVEGLAGYDITKAGSSVDDDSNIDNDQSIDGALFGVGAGYDNVKTNRDLYVGARVGYVVSPRTMVYAKGGYTNAKFDVRNGDGSVETNTDIDADGWRIGAGVEQAVSNNVFAKLEYRYSNYEKGELDYRGDIPDGQRFDLDLDRHQIVAGVGVRF